MKRLVIVIFAFAIVASGASAFDQKLPIDKQIVHVLNRLTFGPRPGDVAEIRRMGIEKWIDSELHPERVAENPVLEAKLKPLGTLHLTNWQLADKYTPQNSIVRPPSILAMNALSGQLRSRLQNGSVEERRATLDALSPDTRRLILA